MKNGTSVIGEEDSGRGVFAIRTRVFLADFIIRQPGVGGGSSDTASGKQKSPHLSPCSLWFILVVSSRHVS